MTPRRFLVSLAAVGVLALSGCERVAPHHYNGIDLTGAAYARQLTLPDFDGKPRTLADFKGKVIAIYFGYTQCPDACPTTLVELAAVAKSLGPDAARLQVVFITVDPARDTAALLKNYVTNFNPTFLALRGDEQQTKATASEFKIFYEKVPGKTDGAYTIDHISGVYLLDTQGHVRLFEKQNMDPALVTADVKALLADTP
ncbi:MAG: SCO family protein [Burkholderiaceae bacterium]